MERKLIPQFDGRKSFYGKAWVVNENGELVLRSYNTRVAKIKKGVPMVKGLYSNTTTRHIKEFLKQNNIKADSTAEIKKYLKSGWD